MATAPGRPRVERSGAAAKLLAGVVLLAGVLLGVALLEASDPATGVQDLQLPGVEGVAGRADVGVDHAVLSGAARRERVATRAGDGRLDVVGVDVGLHGFSSGCRSPGPAEQRVNRNQP